MKKFWHIRPINDGCSVLVLDKDDVFIIVDKGSNDARDRLYFKTEQEAQKYIQDNLNPEKYMPESTLIVDYLICDGCGLPLKIMWNQEINNNSRELVCHCSNCVCDRDYTIVLKNGEVMSKERFFFG